MIALRARLVKYTEKICMVDMSIQMKDRMQKESQVLKGVSADCTGLTDSMPVDQ
jgi:hypothetical protein